MAVVRGNDKVAQPDIFVAECEVGAGDKNIEAVLSKLGLEYVLHNLWGFDNTVVYQSTGTFYEIEKNVEFRSRTKGIIKGVRISGRERLDDEWIEQGNPSEQAKDAARQDISYLKEIGELGRQMKSL